MAERARERGFFWQIIKGACIALVISLVAILIFSGVVKVCKLSSGVIKAVNQFIKIIALFLGIIFSLKENKGLLKGGLVGIIYGVLIHLVFLIIGGEFEIGKVALDVLFCIAVGCILGALIINLRKKD